MSAIAVVILGAAIGYAVVALAGSRVDKALAEIDFEEPVPFVPAECPDRCDCEQCRELVKEAAWRLKLRAIAAADARAVQR